jgi:hypothetical protein
MYSQPSAFRYWQCPSCRRVENWSGQHRPVCTGTPEQPHAAANTRKLMSRERLAPADRHLFR